MLPYVKARLVKYDPYFKKVIFHLDPWGSEYSLFCIIDGLNLNAQKDIAYD
jgi:hypothetical protein